jgi:hypothetical protein
VTITSPEDGGLINTQTPTFSGTTAATSVEELESGVADRVTVSIHKGTVAQPGALAEPPTSVESGLRSPTWTVGPVASLSPGTYTAVAEEQEVVLLGGLEEVVSSSEPSKPVTFTIDTTPPHVSISSPANGSSSTNTSQVISGSADTAPHTLPGVTVQLYSGSSIGSQAPLEGNTVQSSQGTWSVTFGGLSPGTYTARAEQPDEAGNVGMSEPVTFTITTPAPPPPPPPPTATFKWFPATPIVGETISLVSSSTDEVSPITAYAWSFSSNGLFNPGKQLLTTTFLTPGNHTVRLRVTAADGLSTIATETIPVIWPPLTLMAPFPVVRIAGSVTSAGVNLSLLTVQAPVGARVKVTCRGRGCPARSESRLAASSSKKRTASTVVIGFRRFQGRLAAGAVLEIRIFKQGRIGKYTRFVIRRGKLPVRIDTCVGPAGLNPIACPSS